MASVIDPASNPDEYGDRALMLICFREWCQEQLVKYMLAPADYRQYQQLTRDFFNRRTQYDVFRPQMMVLLQNYVHPRVYWDVYHSWVTQTGELQVVDYSLLFYPIYACRQLRLIPAFARAIFGDTEMRNTATQCSREFASRLATRPAAELARQLDFQALLQANPDLYSYR